MLKGYPEKGDTVSKGPGGKAYRPKDKEELLRKIHRALFKARNALHRGDEAEARAIVRQIMSEAAPAALEAGRENGFNWVVEALKPLDELLLPDD